MNKYLLLAFLAIIAPASAARPAGASPQDMVLFAESFEGDMSQWIGPSGGSHNGVIVTDPLNPANHVITFTALADAGDIFSTELPSYHGFVYFLRFDYLGLPKEGTPDANTGGRTGIAQDSPGSISFWLASTIDEPCTQEELIDDGQWHSYVLFFFPECVPEIGTGSFRVMMEDWCGRPPDMPQGVAGDVFFDNIRVDIHEVSVESTSWGAMKKMFR